MGKKKPEQKRILSIPVHVDLDMVIESLHMLSRDQLFAFITEADLVAADYEFTKRLRDHFIKEIGKDDGEEPTLESRFQLYEVRHGDTLSEIAERFGTSSRRLVQLNRIVNSAHIEPNWVLIVPRKK
jgi:hypothetical protein